MCARNVVRSLVKKAAADKDWVAGWQSRVLLLVKNTNVWTRKRGAVIRLGGLINLLCGGRARRYLPTLAIGVTALRNVS